MTTYSLTDARANLPLLLHRAESGEEITITRHGRAVAVLVSHDRWMRTARYEALEEARRLHDHLEEVRGFGPPEPLEGSSYDAEAHVAWNRSREEPWDRVERERRERGDS